jgi:hypothetical protein
MSQSLTINVDQPNSQAVTVPTKQRYEPTRKRAIYKPLPKDRLITVLEECRVADELDATGNTNQPGHLAYTRLRVQAVILSNWLTGVFPRYFKVRIPCDDKLYELIRLRSGSVHSVVSVLNNAVVDAKERKQPIDYPIAWCKGALKNIGYNEYREILKQGALQASIKAELSHVEVTEVPNNVPALPSPKQPSSKPTEQPRKPWEKPTPLKESVWHERYDSTPIGDLIGLNILTLEPGKEGDALVTGNKDKDILERCFVRQIGSNQPFIRTPIEQAAYDRKHPNEDKSARESARKAGVYDMIYGKDEPTKQEDKKPDEQKPLLEFVWKENYRSATTDNEYQKAPTLKGMSIATLTSTFLDSEPACVGDYGTDYKAYTEYRKSKAPVLVR